MEVKRIDIKQFDMHNERVHEPIQLYIELADHYLLYVAEYYGEQPKAEDQEDHTLGWQEMYANFSIKIKREILASLEISWSNKREIWGVEVEANGYPNTIKWYFEKEKSAREFYNTLDEWIFNNK